MINTCVTRKGDIRVLPAFVTRATLLCQGRKHFFTSVWQSNRKAALLWFLNFLPFCCCCFFMAIATSCRKVKFQKWRLFGWKTSCGKVVLWKLFGSPATCFFFRHEHATSCSNIDFFFVLIFMVLFSWNATILGDHGRKYICIKAPSNRADSDQTSQCFTKNET